MVDFADLVEPQTIESVRATLDSAASAVGWMLNNLPPLARLRKLADVSVRTIHAMTEVQSEAIRGGFRDFARGVWLEALAEQVYGLVDGRIEETFATTTVIFTNVSDQPYSFAAGEVLVGNSVTGKAYQAAAFDLAAAGFPGDTASVAVIALEPGTASDAAPGDISEIVGTAYDGVTVTNPNAAAAVDTETDEALRIRATAALAPISPAGAALAYHSIALNAVREDGSPIGVTKVQTVPHVPDMGDLTVYLADSDGPPTGPDIAIIDAEIRARVLPLAVNYLGTFGATPVSVDVTAVILAQSSAGLTASEIETLATQALVRLFASPNENPIGGIITGGPGGTLYQSKIKAVMEQVQAAPGEPFPVFDVSISDPPGNVALDPGEVAVLGTVSLIVTLF